MLYANADRRPYNIIYVHVKKVEKVRGRFINRRWFANRCIRTATVLCVTLAWRGCQFCTLDWLQLSFSRSWVRRRFSVQTHFVLFILYLHNVYYNNENNMFRLTSKTQYSTFPNIVISVSFKRISPLEPYVNIIQDVIYLFTHLVVIRLIFLSWMRA